MKSNTQLKPQLQILAEKKLAGLKIDMSFAHNKTRQLWQNFMPRRKEIENKVNSDFYSIEIYPAGFFDNFDPEVEFQKWAAIEVTDFEQLPAGLETIVIPQGLYAVFLYKGRASEAQAMYQYIFSTWIPHSNFVLDERPHFALMGHNYRNDDPNSEEEIWIPVRPIGNTSS